MWADYETSGVVAGRRLPTGIRKWGFLWEPLFTPSTKAGAGEHDENITVERFLAETGEAGEQAVHLAKTAYQLAYQYARRKGVLILDTKFEGFGILVDEVLTPDSSRFTTEESYFQEAMAQGKDPIFYDKQLVRDVGAAIETPWGRGVRSLDPKQPEQLHWMEGELPKFFSEELIAETSNRYQQIFTWLSQ